MEEHPEGRVLLDVAAGTGEFDRDLLERLGHPVTVCHGPHEATLCPLLVGLGCEGFESAHGIIFELDLDRPQHRALVRRYRELAPPDVPIRVLAPAGQAERYRDALEDVEVWTAEPTVADLDGFAAEVEAADR